MKIVAYILILSTVLTGTAGLASPKAPPMVAPEQTVQVQGPAPAVLEQIFKQATEDIKVVEGLIASGQYGPAELAAKNVFDRVSIVHPKANYRPKIVVNSILSDADLQKDFSQLSNSQKENLAIAVAEYRGGYYLDLLNLAKRAKLLYLKAVYFQMRDKIMDRDIAMIKSSLLEIHNIAILIADKRASEPFMIFDVDVANRDQQYFFNRELLEFAVQIKELKLDERQFDELLRQDRNSKLKEYHAGVRAPGQVPVIRNGESHPSDSPEYLSSCMKKLGAHLNYSGSLRICRNFMPNNIDAFVSCFEKIRSTLNWDDSYAYCCRLSGIKPFNE